MTRPPRLTLRVPRMLAPASGGAATIAVAGADVRAALEDAMRRHPLLRTHLLDESGSVRPHVHVFLNDTDVREDLSAATADGDEITVLQAMSGG